MCQRVPSSFCSRSSSGNASVAGAEGGCGWVGDAIYKTAIQSGQDVIRVHRTQTWEQLSFPYLLMWLVSGNLQSPLLSLVLGSITHHRVKNSGQLAGQCDDRHSPTAPGGQPVSPGS